MQPPQGFQQLPNSNPQRYPAGSPQGQPPQYQQEPGREGMLGPEQSVLQGLLGADNQLRDPGTQDSQLIQAMSQARGQGQMDDMRAIRDIIEGRHTDDIARGPAQQTDPVTSADPNEQSWFQRLIAPVNPFGKGATALEDANQRGLQNRQDQNYGR